MKIFEYTLKLTETQTIQLPIGYHLLDVQVQNGMRSTISLWCEVNSQAECAPVSFKIVGTGQTPPEENHVYVKTVQMGVCVWHLYRKES